MTTPNSVRHFLEDRQRQRSRKDGPNHRHVFPDANVISMAEWSYAKAYLNCEIANAEHKLAKANL